jgi:predicted N-acetyltransferase YhbS
MSALRKLHIAHLGEAAPLAIRAERGCDIAAREALLDGAFGANRRLRTCQRLREGRAPAEGIALSAVRHARLVGTVRLILAQCGFASDRALVY